MRADSGRTDRFFHFPRASRRLILGTALGLVAVVPVAAEELSLTDCARQRRRAPAALDSYACYWRLARRNEIHSARAALADVLAREPENWAAWLYRARIEGDQGEDEAEPHYRLAIAGFSRAGQPRGEGRARLGLALLLGRRGRFAEADVEVAAAEVAARAGGERTLELAVACERGWQALRRGQYGESAERFDSVWPEVSGSGDRALQAYCLSGRGGAAMEMGRFAVAADYTRRQAELCHELGDAYDEARARGNLVLAGFRLAHAGELSRAQVRSWAEEALAAARRGGNRGSEARAELYLGDLTEGAEARTHYRAGLEMSRQTREVAGLVLAHRGLALNAIESGAADSHAAYEEVERARELARGSRFYSVVAELARARMRWHTGPRERAIRDSLAALEAIEAIRDLQADDLVRARVFAIWAFAYHRFAGELLAAPGRSDAELELAFEITERMRARVLLDELDAARVSIALAPRGNLAARRDALLGELATAERALLPPNLPAAERRTWEVRLTALRREEALLRARLFAANPEYQTLRAPRLVTLAELRGALAPDQVLIAFQVANRFNVDNRTTEHGSWIWLVAHDGVAVEPVPDQAELRSAVDLFQGLIARRDGAEREAAAALYGRLFGDLLARFPTARRLVLIPDGPLHRLPFGALRASPGAATLAERYELSIVSSATVWSRLRGGAGSDAGVRPYFLAVSDPQVGAGPDATSEPDASRSNATSSLRPLPWARREATALARAFRNAGESWLGEQATEVRLKRADLAPFGVLHFGAHAQVDDRRPERSAIVLAPDAGGDDGLLTAAEIVRLRVENRIVVLAACRSGGGATLEGEGVLSLARAFFQAGARSVVAALVPLRDDESAELLAELFDRLARGQSVAASLSAADRSQIHAGRPVAAWSAVVALGDGEARLARPVATAPARWFWLALLAPLALAGCYLLFGGRRGHSGPR